MFHRDEALFQWTYPNLKADVLRSFPLALLQRYCRVFEKGRLVPKSGKVLFTQLPQLPSTMEDGVPMDRYGGRFGGCRIKINSFPIFQDSGQRARPKPDLCMRLLLMVYTYGDGAIQFDAVGLKVVIGDGAAHFLRGKTMPHCVYY